MRLRSRRRSLRVTRSACIINKFNEPFKLTCVYYYHYAAVHRTGVYHNTYLRQYGQRAFLRAVDVGIRTYLITYL